MSPYIKDFIQISNRIKHDFKQPSCYCTMYNNDRELSTLLWFTRRVSHSWAVKCITRFVSSKYDRCEYTKGYYICDKLVFSKNHESNNSTVLGGCGSIAVYYV